MADEKKEGEMDSEKVQVELLKTHDQIRDYLLKMQFKQINEDREKFTFVLPLQVNFDSGEQINLKTRILITPIWIFCKCCILFYTSIPKEPDTIFNDLMEQLLYANFFYSELTYSLDEERNIYAECDLPRIGLNFENFESEFNSILFGVLHLYNEIIPKLVKSIKKIDTYKKTKNMYT
ncbi:MAG: hypothetical protein ACTSRB_13465 [Candidatus Helarchaeota archaeon]